jgi:replicative DNA helicase
VLAQEDEAELILAHAESQIYVLTETRYKTQLEPIDTSLEEVVDEAHSNFGAVITGLRTGITDLDDMTTGLQNADLILLAARPSVGKTSEAISIMANVALDYEKTVAFFTLEMSRKAIISRFICNVARVDFRRFRNGTLVTSELEAVAEAQQRLNCNRIWVDDKPAITMLEARAKLHRMEKSGVIPDLIVFDYLQLMTGNIQHRKESRQQEVSGISESLKSLAKEFDRPVLACAQLNRGPEQRSDKLPLLSDLRESGALEQNADVVIFIHKPKTDEENASVRQQFVAKNRNGPTGDFGIYFNGPAMRFDNLQQ